MKKYQLVLQFRATTMKDFEDLAAFESLLLNRLPPLAKVDGHDCGKGEVNIFVHTDHPSETFEAAEVLRRKALPGCDPIVAYRSLDGEDYTVLSPDGDKGFKIS